MALGQLISCTYDRYYGFTLNKKSIYEQIGDLYR